ncbi:MAG: D-alanine--D-alanine ligase [Phycisphaerae bacterium]|nr:D-alanine--D-alanine ligase [Phycisphaerae bacterium]
MNVVILHDVVTDASRPDEADGLHQADLVESALAKLGHRVQRMAVGLDLEGLSQQLESARVDLLFNLVESAGGSGRFISFVPALLEARRLPFTGSGSAAGFLTTNKPLAKSWLVQGGIPTPAWRLRSGTSPCDLSVPATCIIKPVWEDASVGVDDNSIIRVDSLKQVDAALQRASEQWGDVFAEQFVEGREFNLSLLAAGSGAVEVLPVAEIQFMDYPREKPRIVGYRAKWDERSFEYHATPRRFEFPSSDGPLLERLRDLARGCWRLFDLRGYARVDFRVDEHGRAWVLEVNMNPCISPDAGFMAAAQQGGLSSEKVIERVVAAAVVLPTRQDETRHA